MLKNRTNRFVAFGVWVLTFAFAMACGSSSPQNEVSTTLRLEADQSIRASIRSFRLVLKNQDQSIRSDQQQDTTSSFFGGWPYRLRLTPIASADEKFEAIAEAYDTNGQLLRRVRAVSGFLPTQPGELVLWFLSDCTVQCPSNFSCGRDARGTTGCLPDERPPTPIEADAGVDANLEDAGLDASDASRCVPEICGNFVDDDCNGFIDDCQTDAGIDTSMQDAGTDSSICMELEICGNFVDDDCNGFIDDGCNVADVGVDSGVDAARDGSICTTFETCGNSIDDDCNGFIDDGCTIVDVYTRWTNARNAYRTQSCTCSSSATGCIPEPENTTVNQCTVQSGPSVSGATALLECEATAYAGFQSCINTLTCNQRSACDNSLTDQLTACTTNNSTAATALEGAITSCRQGPASTCPSATIPSNATTFAVSTVQGGNDYFLCNRSGGAGGPDRAYAYVPPTSGLYEFSLTGPNIDSLIAIYSGSCPTSGSYLSCNDDAGVDAHGLIRQELVAGASYVVVVDSYNVDRQAELTLNIRRLDASSCSPTALGTTNAVSLTNQAFTNTMYFPGCGSDTVERVYSWTPQSSGSFVVRAPGNGFPTQVSLQSPICSSVGAQCSSAQSLGRYTVNAGQSYFLVVKRLSSSSDPGTFSLNIDLAPPETCPFASLTAVGTYRGDTALASDTYNRTNGSLCDDGSSQRQLTGPDTVYLFTAPAAGTYGFEHRPDSSSYDGVIHLRSPSCSSSTLLACDSSFASEVQVRRAMAQGEQVLVVVDGFNESDYGPFTLTVSVQ